MSAESERAFWAARNAEYSVSRMAEEAIEQQQNEHAACRRIKDVEKLYRRCKPCGERKIRWMATQPAETHIGRNGRRLIQIYGVTL